MGRVHARHLLDIPDIEIVAICDIRRKQLTAYQKKFFTPIKAKPTAYTDYSRMLAKEKLDAVLLVTPHVAHYTQCRNGLEAGLHVLCEKPLVINVEHARELVALAKRRKRLLGIAFQAPVSPEYAYIRDVLRRGDLGHIEMIDAFVAQGWLDLTRNTWRQKPKQSGGGQLYDSGAHLFNGMLWLIDSPIERVFAMVDNCGTPVDINGTVSIRFTNGILASVAVPGNARGPCETGLHIYGSKGTIKTGIWGLELKHYDRNNQRIPYPFVPYEPLTPTQNFIDAVRGNDTLRCPPEMGIRLAEFMEAIYKSVRTQMPVNIEQDNARRSRRSHEPQPQE